MSDFLNDTLGNLVLEGGGKIHTGPFGTQLHASDYVQYGIPCIMPANMKNSRVDLSKIAFITEADAQRLSKYIVKENDIVYSRRGDVTQKALIRKKDEGYFCGTGCLLIRPGTKFDARFLTYYLSTLNIQNWIVSQAVGATMPNLNTGILSSVPFHGPQKKKQEKIANVLSAIDKKIELNNRINAELEAMAKTLYDYWFVQFDFPDAKGKPYKTSGGKMVYNEVLKREIPEGWDVSNISSMIDVKDGTHASPKPVEQGFPLITSKNLKKSGLDFDNANLISEDDYISVNKRSQVDTGDILFSMIGNIGTIYKVDEKEINFAIKNVALYKTSSVPEFRNYIYMYLNSWDMLRYMGNVTAGSIQKFIGLGSLRDMPIFLNEETVARFESKTQSLFLQMTTLKFQNQELVRLRDWLLPMLMNGQVTVK